MTRYINALLVFLMVLSASAVYDMKYEAELASEAIHKQETKVAQVREDISLLKAEWALLTRPSRMQDLVNRHHDILNLVPMTADHIGTLADVPERPAALPTDDKSAKDKPTVAADTTSPAASGGTIR